MQNFRKEADVLLQVIAAHYVSMLNLKVFGCKVYTLIIAGM